VKRQGREEFAPARGSATPRRAFFDRFAERLPDA